MKRICSILALFLVSWHFVSGQEIKVATEILSFLADDISAGRASGSADKVISEQYIITRFKQAGLKPFNWSYTQSFHYNDTIVLRNITGVVPSVTPSDEYVIVSAHYDGLGKLNETVYNGADDNASGVTALLSLAEAFMKMKKDGKGPHKNILFVAFDGKELSMSGSEYFVITYPFNKNRIICNVNMDIMGTTLAPIKKDRPDYLIILGESTLPKPMQGIISAVNATGDNLNLDFSFYGSQEFTRMMYELGDHFSFAKAGIPALLFTSGFHQYTYKPSDDVSIIDFGVLSKRTSLIFNFLNRIAN